MTNTNCEWCSLLQEKNRLLEQEIIRVKQVLLVCQRENNELRNCFGNIHDLIQRVDSNGDIVYVNKSWLEILGYAEEEVIGKNIFEIITPDCRSHCQEKFSYLQDGGKELVNMETVFLKKTGERLIVEGNVVMVRRDDDSFITYGIFRDITHKKELEERLFHLATRDPLTNLSNRYVLIDNLKRDLGLAERHGQKLAIVFFDLDRFKPINDAFGHAAGDAVLVAVADRMNRCMRNSDLAFRFGGDEFGLVLNAIESEDDVVEVVHRLTKSIMEPIYFNEETLTVGASIGFAIYPDDAMLASDLLKLADARMYQQKKEKKRVG